MPVDYERTIILTNNVYSRSRALADFLLLKITHTVQYQFTRSISSPLSSKHEVQHMDPFNGKFLTSRFSGLQRAECLIAQALSDQTVDRIQVYLQPLQPSKRAPLSPDGPLKVVNC
jgi:hypothetical protein